jgi:hypothetical protein
VNGSPGRNAPNDCLEESPFRRPDWRWQLPLLSMEGELARRSGLRDPWVGRVIRHLKAGDADSSARARRRRSSFDPALHGAIRLHEAPDPHARGELEAWILTGEPIEVAAERCGLAIPAAEAYEAAFVDVRARLGAPGYVLHTLIGPAVWLGFAPDDLPGIWKFFGYMRGRHALEVLMHVFPGPSPRPWPASFDVTPAERRRIIAACRGAVLTRCLGRPRPSRPRLRGLMDLRSALRRAALDREALAAPASRVIASPDLAGLGRRGGLDEARPDLAGRRPAGMGPGYVDRPPVGVGGADVPGTPGGDAAAAAQAV